MTHKELADKYRALRSAVMKAQNAMNRFATIEAPEHAPFSIGDTLRMPGSGLMEIRGVRLYMRGGHVPMWEYTGDVTYPSGAVRAGSQVQPMEEA